MKLTITFCSIFFAITLLNAQKNRKTAGVSTKEKITQKEFVLKKSQLKTTVVESTNATEAKTVNYQRSTPGFKMVTRNNVEKKDKTPYQPIKVSSDDKKIIAPKTMGYYDSYIRSIKTKMKYVKSDEVENKKAIEIGWYDEMKSNIAIAEIEKQKLLIDK